MSARGVCVAVNYSRSKAEAEETVQRIREQGGRAFAIQADVSREPEVREMVERVAETFGTVDLLVNNAGKTRHIAFDDLEAVTDEVWEELFRVNVMGMFNCMRAVAGYMKKNGQGAVVNIGSIAGLTGFGSSLPYGVTKSAVHGLTKSLARAGSPYQGKLCRAGNR